MPLDVCLGLGDPVTDVIADVSEDFLASITNEPGGCLTISATELAGLSARIQDPCVATDVVHLPGGSAANVMTCMAALLPTTDCQFAGAVGTDATAQAYQRQLESRRVRPRLVALDAAGPSAVSICLITPDGQRTMRTCLGAASHYTASHLPRDALARCRLMHCEGYMLYKPALLRAAIAACRAGGGQVSLDLASFEVIRSCKAALLEVLASGDVDIVFCNEDEAQEVAAMAPEATAPVGRRPGVSDAELAGKLLLRHCRVAVFTMGHKGAWACARGGNSVTAPACRVNVVDTVGAGDYFCGAFLAAYMSGASLEQCCAAGCAAGAQVVQHKGAHLPADGWTQLTALFKSAVNG